MLPWLMGGGVKAKAAPQDTAHHSITAFRQQIWYGWVVLGCCLLKPQMVIDGAGAKATPQEMKQRSITAFRW